MNAFVIEPRDTLCLRDGRAALGRHMHTLPFPWPSTIAGLARTRVGLNEHQEFDTDKVDAVLAHVAIRGPWLVRYASLRDEVGEACFPAPRDCVWFDTINDGKQRVRLTPQPTPEGVRSNAPKGLDLVHRVSDYGVSRRQKPTSGPAFWTSEELLEWLTRPTNSLTLEKGTRFGIDALGTETRTHVAIRAESRTASDGQLFSTSSLRFAQTNEAQVRQGNKTREHYAIGFACTVTPGMGLVELGERTGSVTIGGERRISQLRRSDTPLLEPPATLSAHRRFRVVLLTPAIFEDGFRPRDIFGAHVTAAVVPGPETISGWMIKKPKPQPKPTRRMAPAGSVYWVEIPPSIDPSVWLERVWLQCISDNEQDRRDGFGLAAVGVE